jgi:hypothetical protein
MLTEGAICANPKDIDAGTQGRWLRAYGFDPVAVRHGRGNDFSR